MWSEIVSTWRPRLPTTVKKKEPFSGVLVTTRNVGIRRILPFIDYYVGDRPKFHAVIEISDDSDWRMTDIAIWQKFPQSKDPELWPGIERTPDDRTIEFDVEASTEIAESGSMSFYIGHVNYFINEQIFTAEATHKSGRRRDFFFIFVGIFLTALGILLSLIR